ncbi:MAG: hypothetical protein ABL914_05410 [Novosphingobium sp.]
MKQTRSGRLAAIVMVLAVTALGACADPNAALNEKVAAAEAAAKRAEDAAIKAEKALADAANPKEAPATMDGGPQLAPEMQQTPPDPMVQSAQVEAEEQSPQQ